MHRSTPTKQRLDRRRRRDDRREQRRAPAQPFDLEAYLVEREREAILRDLGCR